MTSSEWRARASNSFNCHRVGCLRKQLSHLPHSPCSIVTNTNSIWYTKVACNCADPYSLSLSTSLGVTRTHFLWLGSRAASLCVGLQVAFHLHNMVTQKWHHHMSLVWTVDMRVWKGWRRYYCLLMWGEDGWGRERHVISQYYHIGIQSVYVWRLNGRRAMCTVTNTRLLWVQVHLFVTCNH